MRFSIFSSLALIAIATACRQTAPVRHPSEELPFSTRRLRAPQPGENQWPGRQPDGSVLLPNQWSLRPAGAQIQVGDFPVNIAVHPRGKFAAVLDAGDGRHEIVIVKLPDGKIVSRTPVHETFYGLEFSTDGRRLFCSGAGDEVVHEFDFRNGALTARPDIRIHHRQQTFVPCGVALDRRLRRLFVANVWGDCVSVVSLGNETNRVTDIMFSANDGKTSKGGPAPRLDPFAPEQPRRAAKIELAAENAYPYACRLDEKRRRLYVSLWAKSAVAVIDLNSNQIVARWPAQEHPCEMALTHSGKILFVANANRNTVSVFDTATGKILETIWAAFFPQSPPGATPNSLALSPDEKTLFVANANVNAAAVFDVSAPGKSRSLGFIPVGWYPTSVRVTPDGEYLLVANGKGVSPRPNPHKEYVAGFMKGTLSLIRLPRRKDFDAQMAAWTAQAYQCTPLKSDASVAIPQPPHNPVPARPGDPSPLKHVLYILKENRTYDQVFGDIGEGNSDSNLCLFGENVTPNHHKLAREFVLLDNFYADAEVSADGHEWSTAAYATDFIEKAWRMSYGHKTDKYVFPSGGVFPIAFPAGGYLWDRAAEAGVSYRSYGEFVNGRFTMKNLRGHFDGKFVGFNLNYSDQKRADRFIAELHRFETNGDMPQLQVLRLPNDHTHGATPDFQTPRAYLADNDLALGRVVEAVSHSRFWPETAIFVVEDDAQNGTDHVDAHRTVALVISPYTKRNAVDSTMYSTTSMLRTMELILGLRPMSQFDAAATPMFNSFQSEPDLRPYESVPARTNLNEKNPPAGWGANLKMDFSKEDACDDSLLNEAIWRSVRGANAPMPAPIHAAFVRTRAMADDD